MSLPNRTLANNVAEVFGPFGDVGLAHLPPALRRPGPQPCNRIPPTYAAAIAAVIAGRPRWPHLPLWLRIGRMVRRLIRRAVARDLAQLAATVARLEGGYR